MFTAGELAKLPMQGIRILSALVIGLLCSSFVVGAKVERAIWERKNMGVLCAESRGWACELHPLCSMNAVTCYPSAQQP